jgi:hypothetical protein
MVFERKLLTTRKNNKEKENVNYLYKWPIDEFFLDPWRHTSTLLLSDSFYSTIPLLEGAAGSR